MNQKVPKISEADIIRIIRRDFLKLEFAEAGSILSKYKSTSEDGRMRVYAGILKLSHGNMELLKEFVLKANNDFRDIISLAEYPNYSKHAFDKELTEQKRRELISDDWLQYIYWFDAK